MQDRGVCTFFWIPGFRHGVVMGKFGLGSDADSSLRANLCLFLRVQNHFAHGISVASNICPLLRTPCWANFVDLLFTLSCEGRALRWGLAIMQSHGSFVRLA
jgi:hypothetical protein